MWIWCDRLKTAATQSFQKSRLFFSLVPRPSVLDWQRIRKSGLGFAVLLCLGLQSIAAHATTYTFSGTVGGSTYPTCSGGSWSVSGTNYTCSQSITLASGDSILPSSAITIIANGGITLATNNTVGSASVQVNLQAAWGAIISGSSGDTIYGSLTSNSGAISLTNALVTGSVYTNGTVSLTNASVLGNVTGNNGVTTNGAVIGSSVIANNGAISLTGGSVASSVHSDCCSISTSNTNIGNGVSSGSNTITISGGTISGAISTSGGGGIIISNATIAGGSIVTATNVSITISNSTLGTATSSVTVSTNNTVTISASTIYGNVTAGSWTGALTADSSSTIYGVCTSNSNSNVAPTSYPRCASLPASVAYVLLSHSGNGVTCLASNVVVTACTSAPSSGSCSVSTLGVSGNVLAKNTNGTVIATVPFVIASGSSSVAVGVPVTTALSVVFGTDLSSSVLACWNGSGTSCSHTYSDAGFIFTSSLGGLEATIPSQVAGTSSASYYLRAVKMSTTTQACESALVGTTAVNFGYECNNPTTCSSSNLMSLNGGTATTIQRNNNGSHANATLVSMTFDANGNAPFTFNFSDVGKLTLWATKPASGSLLTALNGSSNAFVVKPYDFSLTGIKCYDNTVNPAAADATGSKFCKAGDSFSLNVTARTSTGSTAPNYGQEITPESVRLIPNLVSGLGLSNAESIFGTFGSFSAGIASGSNFYWGEVGIITITPGVGDSDYLDAGDVSGSTSGNVGRFYPYAYTLDSASISNRPSSCATSGSFTYIGEPDLRLNLSMSARNKLNGVLQNYNSSAMAAKNFAKLTTGAQFNLAAYDDGGSASAPNGPSMFAENGRFTGFIGSQSADVAPSWVSGNATLTIYSKLSRTSTQEFYKAFHPGIRPVDSDGVILQQYSAGVWSSAWDIDTETPTDSDHKSVGSTELRYGRLRLLSSYSSELLPATVVLRAEYCTPGSGTACSIWQTNLADSCTFLPANVAVLSTANAANTCFLANPRSAASTCLAASPTVTLSSGKGSYIVYDKTHYSGSVDMALNLGVSGTTHDSSCNANSPASTAANLPWLQYSWCSGKLDPNARLKFGSPKAPYIYLRERF